MGALGVSLGTMVANLSANKRGWDDKVNIYGAHAARGQDIKDRLLHLVDEDTNAFNKIIDAVRMPKNTAAEKTARQAAMDAATEYAIEVPLQVMKTSLEAFDLLKDMAAEGNPNSVSDAGVGALACRAAVRGAALNVQINCAGYTNEKFVTKSLAAADRMMAKAAKQEDIVMKIVNKKIG